MSYEGTSVLPANFGLHGGEPNASVLAPRVRGLLRQLLARYGVILGFLLLWQVSST